MKKTTLSIIITVIALAAAMTAGCSPVSAAQSTNASSASVVISSYVKSYDENPADKAYAKAFAEANELWPWAERAPKVRYASLAADFADAYLTGDENWLPSEQAELLMAQIIAELEQSQDEILALKDSGKDDPRLDPYNLGHAEIGGGRNDDSDPSPSSLD